MGEGTLTIYSASAGSGKTHKLTGIYLEKLFRSRLNYRKILAVTFTHKATAEMKNRILEELYRLATNGDSKYLNDLIGATGKNEQYLRTEAGTILYSILHDYSRFSVSTIDSFYQKIIRAFARDVGLHSGFGIETDYSRILSAAVDNVIESAAADGVVQNWLTSYAKTNIDEGKSWDIKKSILRLSGELFNEKFRLLSDDEKRKMNDKEFLLSYIGEMKSVQSTFVGRLRELGLRCQDLCSGHGVTDDMFFQKGRGVPAFIRSTVKGETEKKPNSYVRAIFEDPPKWSSGAMTPQLATAISSGLDKLVREAVLYYDKNIVYYNSAEHIRSNIYILGILSDVLRNVHHITRDENTFLLSDAGELIYLITSQDQAPFIYERTGNTFENFMIDEFQDTSAIQWQNFSHLVENSMAQGFDNLVVGDVKQSIYRWRNSDWRTLNELRKYHDKKRFISIALDTNFRSCSNIISFNNALFSVIPGMLDKETEGNPGNTSFSELFSEAGQKDPGRKKGGYVRLQFVENDNDMAWSEYVLNKLPSEVEALQDLGFRASDIGILVRDNSEGAIVLKRMISYGIECPEINRTKYNYNIVSGESLLLGNSAGVNFLISVLRVLDNPDDMISRAMMLRYFLLASGKEGVGEIPLTSSDLAEISASFFPEGWENFLSSVQHEQVWNITENSIAFFGLGRYSFNVPYFNSFQDLVINFSSSGNHGVSSFLDWWETEGTRKSILLPEQQESMKVLTIHKSKGLEFRVVILPFISWNLDHKPFHSNILWAVPGVEPFNKLGIVPVRYKSSLENSIFADLYFEERQSAYLDNLNLLYVALTRAVEVLIGFAPKKPEATAKIAEKLREAVLPEAMEGGIGDLIPGSVTDKESGVFIMGTLSPVKTEAVVSETIPVKEYIVGGDLRSLKLRLHWEDYITPSASPVRERINYGRLMHEIFSEIKTIDDIDAAMRKMVNEGKIPEKEEKEVKERISGLLDNEHVRKWFDSGTGVYNEASFLLPDSSTRRPDRIVIRDGKVSIIDFKFGKESESHIRQVRQYSSILQKMGYVVDEACLWYVDSDKIVQI